MQHLSNLSAPPLCITDSYGELQWKIAVEWITLSEDDLGCSIIVVVIIVRSHTCSCQACTGQSLFLDTKSILAAPSPLSSTSHQERHGTRAHDLSKDAPARPAVGINTLENFRWHCPTLSRWCTVARSPTASMLTDSPLKDVPDERAQPIPEHVLVSAGEGWAGKCWACFGSARLQCSRSHATFSRHAKVNGLWGAAAVGFFGVFRRLAQS